MKKVFTYVAALLMVGSVYAQSYHYVPYTDAKTNPGGLNTDLEYPVGGGISAGWSTLLTGNQASPAWANGALPFAFDFAGVTKNNFSVSSSGVLTFADTKGAAPAYGSVALPAPSVPDSSVCILGIRSAGSNQAYANVVTKTFGSAPNRQFWITYSAYNGMASSDGFCFWSFVLEETTNNIYVVDMRSYGAGASGYSVGIQMDASTAITVAGSPNLSSIAGSANTGGAPGATDNGYYLFRPGMQPSFDIEAKTIAVVDYLILSQGPFSIMGSLRNTGTTPVTTFDLNYSIDGGTTVTQNVTGVNIAKFGTYNYNHTTKWSPANVGKYTIKVWASNINGNADENMANDAVEKQVEVVDNFVERELLNEVFTSSSCPPCRPGNQNLETNIFPNRTGKYTVIKYQMNYPGNGDPYYTSEAGTRHQYYGVNSIPRVEADGQWNDNANDYTTGIFDGFQSKPAFVELTATHTLNWNQVKVNVSIKPLADNASNALKLHVAVLEKKTTKNIATNGETEFFNVMKKMLPNASGTALSAFTKNNTVTKDFSYFFPGAYRLPPNGVSNVINIATENSVEEFDDLTVVVFVQDDNTKLVLQSAWSTGTVLSVEKNIQNDGSFGVFPNPGNGITQVAFKLDNETGIQLNVYNALGQLVKTVDAENYKAGFNAIKFDASDLAKGMYIIKMESENWSRSERFVVN